MRPPGKSPQQEWFDNLPDYDPEQSDTIFAIFTGVVNDVQNVIVRIDVQKNLRVVMSAYNVTWRFDYARSRLYSEYSSGSNWSQQIVEQVGMGLIAYDRFLADSIDYNMITCKLNPTSP